MQSELIVNLLKEINSQLTDPDRNQIISNQTDSSLEQPRFELYHNEFSICSAKVRMTLAEKNQSYFSHNMMIYPPQQENYLQGYVRLRLQGRNGKPLVSGYSGSSSVANEGFDALVVPTLVDRKESLVVTDSLQICRYIDSQLELEPTLCPEELNSEIERQIEIVDRTPHVALLYSQHPDPDPRPKELQKQIDNSHEGKIQILQENLAKLEANDPIVEAYQAKIKKETIAQQFSNKKINIQEKIAETAEIVAQLEQDLAESKGLWLYDARFTLADLFWTISLFRLDWLGMDYLWSGQSNRQSANKLPRLQNYLENLYGRKSFQEAVVQWVLPNFPSENVAFRFESTSS